MKNNITVFRQLLLLIPQNIFNHSVDTFSGNRYVKNFDCWSQFIANTYAQASGKDSLREIETGMKTHKPKWYHLGLSGIARSTISYANQNRNYKIYESLFYALLKQFRNINNGSKKKFKFKNPLHLLDSTTISLCLSTFEWAHYRRKKGGIKLHCLLDQRNGIPDFIVVTDAKQSDIKVAKNTQWPLSPDSIICFDKAYIDFKWLQTLNSKGVFFVTRAKNNIDYTVVGQLKIPENKKKKIIEDSEIKLNGICTSKKYTEKLRLIIYYDKDGDKTYEFITNNFKLSASTIANIYKARWDIETFFKWIKQNLKIKTFLGTTENAVLTQIWTAMIYYLLLSYLKFQTKYSYALSKLALIICETLFEVKSIIDFLSFKKLSDLKINTGQLSMDFG